MGAQARARERTRARVVDFLLGNSLGVCLILCVSMFGILSLLLVPICASLRDLAHVTSAIDQSAAVGDFMAQESMGCPLTDSGCETKEGKADVEFTCETPFDEHCQCLKMGKTNQLKYLVKERATVCTGADWADMKTRRSMKDGARYAEFAQEWKARKLHAPMGWLKAQKKM